MLGKEDEKGRRSFDDFIFIHKEIQKAVNQFESGLVCENIKIDYFDFKNLFRNDEISGKTLIEIYEAVLNPKKEVFIINVDNINYMFKRFIDKDGSIAIVNYKSKINPEQKITIN